MKRLIVLLLIIIVSFFLFLNNKEDEQIRVRIIPNSNEEDDIIVKEKVKNVVVYYLEELYSDDYKVYFDNINKSYKALEEMIDDNIVDVTISFNRHTLYNKAYNDNAVQNNEFYTLYVLIDKANGRNWWSSVYPEFLADGSSEEIEYKSLIYELIKRMEG